MTETVEQIAALKSPLHEMHEQIGATMIERDGWFVPRSFGDVLGEYAAVREAGAGLLDLSPRGRLLVSGTEAIQFLNGLITNDMKTLTAHSWMPAAFPSVQGRLIASVRVVRPQDEKTDETERRTRTDKNVCPTFLIDTEAATHNAVLKSLERFTLAGDFHVTDVTGQTAMLSLQGRGARDIVRAVLGERAAVSSNQVVQIGWPQGSDVVVHSWRATHTAEEGFDLVIPAAEAGKLFEACKNAGARPVGYEALETLRIEAGLPRYGVDMDETNIVTETALDDAVSYTKGCYVGQEIIARIKYRGHVAKKLAGMKFEKTVPVAKGMAIRSTDGKEIGRITSATISPALACTIALGYLKYDYLAPGTAVNVVTGEADLEARVCELPFVKGSWGEEREA
ncbi:MAG TPA: aminomethyltransferase family protein [Pyrinomonadaceae bacterium]